MGKKIRMNTKEIWVFVVVVQHSVAHDKSKQKCNEFLCFFIVLMTKSNESVVGIFVEFVDQKQKLFTTLANGAYLLHCLLNERKKFRWTFLAWFWIILTTCYAAHHYDFWTSTINRLTRFRQINEMNGDFRIFEIVHFADGIVVDTYSSCTCSMPKHVGLKCWQTHNCPTHVHRAVATWGDM